MLAWWPSQPVSVSEALRNIWDSLSSTHFDIFDAIGRIFQNIERYRLTLCYRSFPMKWRQSYITSSQWSLPWSHAMLLLRWKNEWGSSRPRDFLATVPQASLPSTSLSSFSKCSYPQSPPVLLLYQSLWRWGEEMCCAHCPPHASCLCSLCWSPQRWKRQRLFDLKLRA